MQAQVSNKTTLCIPYTHTISHISRPLLIARELRDRGHHIVFAGESNKIQFIKQEGFDVLPMHEPDPDLLYGNIRKGKLRFVSNEEIEQMIEADITLFNEVKPDIVITDGRFSAPISSYIYGVKHVAIVNVSSTEYRALPYVPLFEWIPEWVIRRDTGLWNFFDSFNLHIEMFIFDNVMNIFKKLSKKYGIKNTVTATNCLTGKDVTLLADIPEYFPAKKMPGNYHYIGPLTWKNNIAPPSWWPPNERLRPLIYITMGTTGVREIFHQLYELIKSSEIKAIITTGAQVESIEAIDGKIYVEPFLDGDLVMAACDLVVCHGGNGTIYQALQHGKPIVGIPTIPDQEFNMRRVISLGLGRMLHEKDIEQNPACFLQMIRDILNDKSCFQNALKFKNLLTRYNAAETAADLIL